MMTRRSFLGAATAFGAFGGCRFLELPGGASSGKPNLRFGVVSDIHFVMDEGLLHYPDLGPDAFVEALSWFRDRGADAVVCCGDMADRSLAEELMAVGRAWDRVFPDGRAPDGRPVEKLFVMGNHDFDGYTYGHNVRRIFPDPVERARHVIASDFAGWWRKAFHEDFTPVWRKEVNGYAFIGAHWLPTVKGGGFNPRLADFYAANGRELDPSRPFFHIQHPHPGGTCCGPWAWGNDKGLSTKILSAYPNAIAFSGHSHYTLTDPRFIWQGAFTSVDAASLCGAEVTIDEFKSSGGLLVPPLTRIGRQGMLWSVFDDHIEIERRDIRTQLPIGETLTMPLPAAEAKPFAFAAHAKRLAAPEFRAGYAMVLEPDGDSAMKVLLPAVKSDSAARCYYYELVCTSGAAKVVKRVSPQNAMLAEIDPYAAERTVASIPLKDLPPQPISVVATPVGYFGKRGHSLSAEFSQTKWRG